MWRLQKRLGGGDGDAFEKPSRPKGMHQRTYKSLIGRVLDGELAYLGGPRERFHFFENLEDLAADDFDSPLREREDFDIATSNRMDGRAKTAT
jgi:hypothetical protein